MVSAQINVIDKLIFYLITRIDMNFKIFKLRENKTNPTIIILKHHEEKKTDNEIIKA